MAAICADCLTTTPTTTTGRCTPCHRAHDRTRRPPSAERYPAEYRANRATLLATNPPCHWQCGRQATTADHLIPRSQGGDHSLDNLVPACAPCNTSRGNRDQPGPGGAGPKVRTYTAPHKPVATRVFHSPRMEV